MRRRDLARHGRSSRLLGRCAAPAGDALWSPFDITGLGAANVLLWLSARVPDSYYQERTTPTTPAVLTGDPVGTWLDQSGNARHVVADNDGSRPTISAAALGGYSSAEFIGFDRMNVSFNADVRTAITVTRTTAGSNIAPMVDYRRGSGYLLHRFEGAGNVRTYNSVTLDKSTTITSIVPTLSRSSSMVFVSTVSDAQIYQYLNGTVSGPAAGTRTAMSGTGTFRISNAASGEYYLGHLFEVILLDVALSGSQVGEASAALQSAYGIS